MPSPTPKRARHKDGRFKAKDTVYEPPKTRAVELPEVVEQILLYLPLQDLLHMTGVSKTWKAIISGSQPLQRALFFAPATCGAVSWIDWRTDYTNFYEDNNCKLNLGPSLRGEDNEVPVAYRCHWGQSRTDMGDFRVFVNPLLAKHFEGMQRFGLYGNEKMETLPEAFQYPTASWKKMSLTQPPIKCLIFCTFLEDDDESTGWRRHLCMAQSWKPGIVTGDFFRRLERKGRIAWIDGRDDWEDWENGCDLARIEAKKTPAP